MGWVKQVAGGEGAPISRVRRVLLVGGSPAPSSSETVRTAARSAEAVVAVDRGLDALVAAGVACDLFCGDADSVGERGARLVREAEAQGGGDGARALGRMGVERYNPHKDFTDLSLALRAVQERWGAAAITLTCFGGGNPDHCLGVLGRVAAWPAPVALVEDGYRGRVLHGGEVWELPATASGRRFSFVPLSEEACVSEAGLRWELDHAQVPLLSDLGISNVVEDARARIACHEGTLAAWLFM